MAKKVLFAATGLLLVIGGLVGIKVRQFQAMFAQQAHAAAPAEAVAVSKVRSDTLRPTLEAIGTITAVQGVNLNAEVAGTIRRIAFESGAKVKTGQVLVELDASVEKAQLEAAEASAELARSNLESGKSLLAAGAMPDNQFRTLKAQAKQAQAEVNRLRALIAKKTIRAPFGGRTGMRQINLGQFVGNGDTLVALQSLDPLFVDFTLPEQRLGELHVGADLRVHTEVFPGQTFAGKLVAIHPEIDAATRNLRLRGKLENPEGKLRPGMFAKAEVVLPNVQRVLVVPATSISYATYGDSVFVVENAQGKQPTARQKFVRLGASIGDFVVVTDGLQEGEDIVTSGAFKLRNGTAVTINNALKPEPSHRPKPTDT